MRRSLFLAAKVRGRASKDKEGGDRFAPGASRGTTFQAIHKATLIGKAQKASAIRQLSVKELTQGVICAPKAPPPIKTGHASLQQGHTQTTDQGGSDQTGSVGHKPAQHTPQAQQEQGGNQDMAQRQDTSQGGHAESPQPHHHHGQQGQPGQAAQRHVQAFSHLPGQGTAGSQKGAQATLCAGNQIGAVVNGVGLVHIRTRAYQLPGNINMVQPGRAQQGALPLIVADTDAAASPFF
uniref:Uncharacterized protein n=1 Tax=Steinernema glaseri TaxID=37863 RepID=A0A1I7Y815_9BILA